MNTHVNTVPEAASETAAIPAIRLFYWSVRRELWENRLIYVAPFGAAVIFLIGFIVSLVRQRHMQSAWAMPYEFSAGLIMGVALIVGVFYSLDALYGERRDRSILFWKSLPVSDLITVLSKLTIPVVIIPLLSFVITIVTQFIMVLLAAVLLLGRGPGFIEIWTQASFFHVSVTFFYHLVTVHGLWYAPIYGWLLFISAWAPRAPFVWASLPPFVIFVVEKIAFNTSHFVDMLLHRLMGPEQPMSMKAGSAPLDPLAALIPTNFFSEPGLWIGLAIAAAFLAAAVRLRRYRGPV